MVDILRNVQRTIAREGLIEQGDRVLIGISGGMDSTALLFVLLELQKKMTFEIGLLHVNHMLRGKESQRDERFVRKLARDLLLPIHVKRVDVKTRSAQGGLSIQHAARELRYLTFDEICKRHHYNKVAVAHNLDDQIETFLLRAIKGTGLRGVTAIPIKRGSIVRPFLFTYRSDIESYVRKNTIPFVEDSSNKKTVYERNFLRKKIFPLMENLNPLFKEKLFLLLGDLTYINGLFEGKAQRFVQDNEQVKDGDICLPIEALNQIDGETRFRVISTIVSRLNADFVPLREHLRQINYMVRAEKPNLVATLPHGIRVRRVYGNLIFTARPAPQSVRQVFPVFVGRNYIEPLKLHLSLARVARAPAVFPNDLGTALFDYEKLGALTIRTFRNGDRFTPLGMKHTVKLKDFFISAKIPKDDRKRVPLLFSDDEIIWVVGYRISDSFKITQKTGKVLKASVGLT
ncbi:MAG TPA: tRNA lysidine(34) synthetase TilS [Syntrophorhabdaceae bacterium]|nr:tRNA lysidine(34) synthetase TilS [Syntrophorhabdaceae bacterium]